jgi:hypothetical protein
MLWTCALCDFSDLVGRCHTSRQSRTKLKLTVFYFFGSFGL